MHCKNKRVILTQLRLPELHFTILNYTFSNLESQLNILDSVAHIIFLETYSCYLREPSQLQCFLVITTSFVQLLKDAVHDHP